MTRITKTKYMLAGISCAMLLASLGLWLTEPTVTRIPTASDLSIAKPSHTKKTTAKATQGETIKATESTILPALTIAPAVALTPTSKPTAPSPQALSAALQQALDHPQAHVLNQYLERLNSCLACQEIVRQYLLDPLVDSAQQARVARWLAEFGSVGSTLLLVDALERAYHQQLEESRDNLLQALPFLQSEAAAKTLVDLIAEQNTEGTPFASLPNELQAALQKSVQVNPHTQAVGKQLAQQFFDTDQESIASDLLQTQQPEMLRYLAYATFHKGDIQQTEEWVTKLTELAHPGVLDSLAALDQNAILPPAVTGDLAYRWASEKNHPTNTDLWQARLSEPDATPSQQIVAVWTVAAQAAQTGDVEPLYKAMGTISDPVVQAQLEAALQHLATPTTAGASK